MGLHWVGGEGRWVGRLTAVAERVCAAAAGSAVSVEAVSKVTKVYIVICTSKHIGTCS